MQRHYVVLNAGVLAGKVPVGRGSRKPVAELIQGLLDNGIDPEDIEVIQGRIMDVEIQTQTRLRLK